jgi:hypothetical protein
MKTTLPFFSGAMIDGCDGLNVRGDAAETQLEAQDDLRQARSRSHSRHPKPWLANM